MDFFWNKLIDDDDDEYIDTIWKFVIMLWRLTSYDALC